MGMSYMSKSKRPPVVVEIRRTRALDRPDDAVLFEQISGKPQQAGNRLVVSEVEDTAIADAFRRAGYDKLDVRKQREEEREKRKQERLDALRKTAEENKAKRVTTEEETMDTAIVAEKARLPDWNDLADGKVKAGERYIAPNGAVLVAGDPLPPEMLSKYRLTPKNEFEPVTDEQVATAEVMAGRAKARRLQTPAQRRVGANAPGAAAARKNQGKASSAGKAWARMTPEEKQERMRKMREGRVKPNTPDRAVKVLAAETAKREGLGMPALGRLMTAEERLACNKAWMVEYNRRYRAQIRAGERPAPDSWNGALPGEAPKTTGRPRTVSQLPATVAPENEAPLATHGQVQPFHEWAAPAHSTIGVAVDGVRYAPTFAIEDDAPMPPPPGLTVWPFTIMRPGQSFKVPIDHRGATAIVKEVEKQAKKHAPGFEFLIAVEAGHVRCWRRK